MIENLIPVKESYMALSNAQIAQALEKEIISINLYPIFAMRMQDNPDYKKRLLQEAVKAENMNMRMSGILKAAWIPIISIIDYGTEKDIVDAVNVVKSWPSNEIILNFN